MRELVKDPEFDAAYDMLRTKLMNKWIAVKACS